MEGTTSYRKLISQKGNESTFEVGKNKTNRDFIADDSPFSLEMTVREAKNRLNIGNKNTISIDDIWNQANKGITGLAKKAQPIFQGLKNLETKATQYLDKNKELLKSQYLKDNPIVIDSDKAKEYFKPVGYNASNAIHFQEPASRLTNKIFEEQLPLRRGKGNNTVLMTGGGPGVGKSTAVANTLGQLDNPIAYDSSMSNFESSSKRIDKSLQNGYNVDIVVVLRDPVKAWMQGVLTRTSMGERHVALPAFLDMTEKLPGSIIKLNNKYKDNPKVNFNVIDNNGGINDIKQVGFDKLEEFNNYLIKNKERIKNDILKQTDELVKSGGIKKELLPEIYGKETNRGIAEGITRGTGQSSPAFSTVKQTGVNHITTEKAEKIVGKKLPKENINGDCYDKAYRYFNDNPAKDSKIVRGMVDGQGPLKGIRYDHAWIEQGDWVIDPSNKRKNPIRLPRIVYYAIGNIKEEQLLRFGEKEVLENVKRTGRTSDWKLTNKSNFGKNIRQSKLVPDSSNTDIGGLPKREKDKAKK